MKRLLHRWFNHPLRPDAPFIMDSHGEKFWTSWDEIDSLYIWHRGKPVGSVNLLWKEKGEVILADIVIFPTYRQGFKFRKRGLGKAMLQEAIHVAKQNHAVFISGWIQPHDGTTQEYLAEWYKRQGFVVEGTQLFMSLQNEF